MMKNAVVTLALASVAFCAFAGSTVSSLQQSLFGVSFEEYQPGDPLTDLGADNTGTWGEVPKDAAIAIEDPERGMYMYCSAVSSRLLFSPYTVSEKNISMASVSIQAAAYESLQEMPYPQGARAAFSIYVSANGETNYMGWVCSQNCWTNLYPISGVSTPALYSWQEVMVKFFKTDSARTYVQYWLKREGEDDYVSLKTADGVSWIDAGSSYDKEMLGKVELSGDGGLEWISGTEKRRGLLIGIGSWYDVLFDESIYNQSAGGRWTNGDAPARTRSDELRSYVIDVETNGNSVTYTPSRMHSSKVVEVTEFEVVFTDVNDDDSIPDDACARIRMVESSGSSCRFACLVAGQWKTNTTWNVTADAKYTVEISLDNGNRTVSYRFKEGYGLEGGAYRDLFLNEPMQPDASGKTLDIDFDGYGIVHEIKGKNRAK